MNFDFSEILSRAFQITWKHKILWLFSALPTLVSFLIFPIMFIPIFSLEEGSTNTPFFVDSPVYGILFFLFFIFIFLISYVLYGISSAAVVLGAKQANEGTEGFTFKELFIDSKPYWWRVLGVLLLIGLSVSLVFMAIFGCFALFGAVTVGLGFFCMVPVMLLMYPLMMVLYAIIEESQVAVVADDLGVLDAIRRGWELVRANFWPVVLISLVVYVGISILTSIVMLPLMSPMFLIPFLMDSGSDFSPRTMMLIMGGFSLVFIPVMALVQGIAVTFMKSTYTLVYLRLTGPQENAPVIPETNE
ncbi:MAG TPA: hypothetical protein VK851_03065 [Anaerolineales bacterium]|nr:hypothetical protein [Anaerolineales bacterium]